MDELCLQDRVTFDNQVSFDTRYADGITIIDVVFEKLEAELFASH